MKPRNDRPVLLVSTPIEDRLRTLEEKAADIAAWEGDDAASVRSIRLCIAEVRRGMREAEERWETTAETARLTGWSVDTLTRYAKMMEDGDAVPVDWRRAQARRGIGGYLWQPSTVPPKPQERKAS